MDTHEDKYWPPLNTQHTCNYLLIRIVNQGVRIQLQDGPDSFEHVRAIKLLDPSLFLLQEIQSFGISPQHFQTLRCSCNISEINFPSKNHPLLLLSVEYQMRRIVVELVS